MRASTPTGNYLSKLVNVVSVVNARANACIKLCPTSMMAGKLTMQGVQVGKGTGILFYIEIQTEQECSLTKS